MPRYYAKKRTITTKRPRYTKSKSRPTYTKRAARYSKNNASTRYVGRTKSTIQRGILPFGRAFFARLPYSENFDISIASTDVFSNIGNTFRLNNVHDPRFQIGGHQPMQYDLLAPAYERVWVHGAKVELSFSNPSVDGMYVGYRVRSSTNNVTTGGQTIEYLQEMRDSHLRGINNSGSQVTKYNFYVPNYCVLGISKMQYANLEYSHQTIVGGTAVATFVEPFAINPELVACNIRCNVRITYYCQFTNPVTQPQS